jgi:hypothetical protein
MGIIIMRVTVEVIIRKPLFFTFFFLFLFIISFPIMFPSLFFESSSHENDATPGLRTPLPGPISTRLLSRRPWSCLAGTFPRRRSPRLRGIKAGSRGNRAATGPVGNRNWGREKKMQRFG